MPLTAVPLVTSRQWHPTEPVGSYKPDPAKVAFWDEAQARYRTPIAGAFKIDAATQTITMVEAA